MPRWVSAREAKKQQEQAIRHSVAQHGSAGGRMLCIVEAWGDKLTIESGNLGGLLTAFKAKFPKEKLPWEGKEAAEPRPFETCAEAQAWLQLRLLGKNPKHYTITSFASHFKDETVAPPCKNCSQWVTSEFREVTGIEKAYRTESKQNPQYSLRG